LLIVSSSLSLLIVGAEIHPRLTVIAEQGFYYKLCACLCVEHHNFRISRLAAREVDGWIIEYCRATYGGAPHRFWGHGHATMAAADTPDRREMR
jgi:hypothetical protein